MAQAKEIWVLPEIEGKEEEVSKLSCGMLTEARYIAEKVNGQVTALLFGDTGESYPAVMKQYGVANTLVFKHTLLKDFSAEIYASVLAEKMRREKPWLFLMGNTTAGKELMPRLAVALETGVVANCVKMDLSNPEKAVFYRPTWGEQAYQEIIFSGTGTMLVMMDPGVLNVIPANVVMETKITTSEPDLKNIDTKVKHLEYLKADFQTIDVTEAEVIVSAGTGAASDELLPLVRELATLVEGAIGTTRPVVDEGKISRERLIGQTGKVVSPDLYLALGISGATHHVGGIQESGTVVAINRDPQSPIFQNADVGAIADLKEVLPRLIEKIKQAKQHGQIL